MEIFQLAAASNALKEQFEKNNASIDHFVDSLTGLLNMKCFLAVAEEKLRNIQKNSTKPAIVSFNLSGLKLFNSKYGMEAGNMLLCAFAKILIRYFSEINCSRFSEDHFYVITDMNGLSEKLEALFAEVKEINDGKSLPVRAGIYNKFDKYIPASVACDRARIACDHKRSSYVSLSIFFDDRMEKALLDRDYIISNLDKALENGYVKVYYQPQIRLLDGKMCGVEALARWEDPEYGNLSPAVFIPILEDNNLTYKLDKFIIKSEAKDIVNLYKIGWIPVPVSFNLSRTDFISMNPSYELERITTEYGLPKYMFRIEITESTVMEDPEGLREQIKKFHEMGFEVLMDDFGSAYSSLNTLRDFEFDEIKIDRCFLNNFSDKSKTIIESMILMAKKIGIHALTEGAETAEQVEFLRKIGCEIVQGYYYGKPVCFDSIEKMIASNDLIREEYEEKTFFESVGLVNVINDNPFALVLYNGRKFELFYSNDKFNKIMHSNRTPEAEVFERIVNSPLSNISRKIRQNADKAIKSGRDEEVTIISNNRIYKVVFRDIAGYVNGRMLKVFLYDITFEDDGEIKEQINNVLRNLVTVFSSIYYIDYNEDTIRNVVSDKRFGELSGTTGRFSEFLDLLLQKKRVCPVDEERFIKAFDNEYISEKMKQINRESYSEMYRIKMSGSEYSWIEFMFIALPASERKKILLSLRILENGEKDEFINEIKRVAGPHLLEKSFNVKGEEIDFNSYIFNSLMDKTELKFFWKDTERRFFGANEAFLDYFGIRSSEIIQGKTDEELGWHINDPEFEADELRVIIRGETVRNSHGRILVNGIERKIVANKYPIIKNGEIIGLVGYFVDSDTVLSPSEEIDNALFMDINSGLMNIRGLFLMLQSYDDNRRKNNKNYGIALIEISNYSHIYVKYGQKLTEKLVNYVVRCINRSFGKTAVIAQTKNGCYAVCDKEYTKQQITDMAEHCKRKIDMSTELNVFDIEMIVNYGVAMGDEREGVQDVFSLALLRLLENRSIVDGGDFYERMAEEVIPDVYRDLPLPYAIIRPYVEDGKIAPSDVEYLFINQKYSDMCGMSREKLIGKTYKSVFNETEIDWVTYAKRATNGEIIKGRGYGGAFGHWVDFIMAPASIPGTCYIVLWPIDDSKKERDLLTKGHATDNAIIKIARYLNGIKDYELSINRALSEIGRTVHSKMIHILDATGKLQFEWRADGNVGLFNDENLKKDFDLAVESLNSSPSIVIDNIQDDYAGNSLVKKFFEDEGIDNVLITPLYDNGEIIAIMSVENFLKDETVNTKQLAEDASYFISAKMLNNRLMKELDKLSTRDTLTGLMNRQGFRNEVEKLMDYYPELQYTLIVLDIDDFKLVNDAYGHLMGDKALQVLAANLEEVFSDNCVISRSGGDEFCVLAKDKDQEEIEQLIKEISEKTLFIDVNGKMVKFTISIGYSDTPVLTTDIKILLEEADAALYEVKSKCKGSYKRYSADMNLTKRSQLAFNLDAMTENLPSAVMVYKAEDDRKILYVNKVFIKLFGCVDFEDFIETTGGTINGVVYKDDALRLKNELEVDERYGNGTVFFRIVTKDGNVKMIECRRNVVENNFYGRVVYMLLTDIEN